MWLHWSKSDPKKDSFEILDLEMLLSPERYFLLFLLLLYQRDDGTEEGEEISKSDGELHIGLEETSDLLSASDIDEGNLTRLFSLKETHRIPSFKLQA